MGMLIRRHRDRHSETATPKPKRARKRNAKAPAQVDPPKADDVEADKAPGTEPDPGAGGNQVTGDEAQASWSDLTDDQLLEAYATNVPDGEATDREAIVAELTELDAESDSDSE